METNGHGDDIKPANIELSNNLYNDSKSTADTSNNITNTSTTNNPDTNNTNTNNDTNNHTNGTSDNSTEKRPISAFSNR